MPTDDTYTLRQVADLTGLSEFTLRGWEGRYNAFSPKRTDTGRRRYTGDDLKRAFVMRELVNLGIRIGDIAKLSNSSLKKKLDLHISNTSLQIFSSIRNHEKIESILNFVLIQDWNNLRRGISNLVHRKKPIQAIEQIILPLLSGFSNFVSNEKVGIAQEHIFSSIIKEQLYNLLIAASKTKTSNSPISFVISTPEGDFHELGILVAYVLLKAHGVNTLYMGPNTPKNELCETAIKFEATHILLASTVSKTAGSREDIYSYLYYLDQHLQKSTTIWVGGKNIEGLNIGLNRSLAIIKSLLEIPILAKKLNRKD